MYEMGPISVLQYIASSLCISVPEILQTDAVNIEGNKYQNNTRVNTETVRHDSTYIILFLTWRNESINDYTNSKLYTSSPCLTCSVFILLMTSQSIADDITITRQLWCDHVNNDI